ncbi:DUF2247 family protein [bacterium]|nr:DUF2247 family protein [bacterium]
MYIKSKYTTDQMNNLYKFILNKQHNLHDILQYYFDVDNVNETEKELVDNINSLISIIDIEFGEAELENRTINTQLTNDTLNKISDLLELYFVKTDIANIKNTTETLKILKEIVDKNFASNNNITDLAYICPNDMNDLLINLYDYENKTINDDIKLKISRYIHKLEGNDYLSSTPTIYGKILSDIVKKFKELKNVIEDELLNFYIPFDAIIYLNDLFVIIFSSIGRYVYSEFTRKNYDFVKTIFNYMDSIYFTNKDISVAIATGFIEAIINRIDDDSELKLIVDIMPNNLKNYALAYKDNMNNINDNNISFFKRKVRYNLLCDLNNRIKDEEQLLFKIGEIYEYFDCPEDMNDFIYYMPITDNSYNPSKHSKSENYKRLIDLFHKFLENEKKLFKNSLNDWIKMQNMDFPPSGHIDDILNLKDCDNDCLFDYSLNMLESVDTSVLQDGKKLQLYVYLEATPSPLIEHNILYIKENLSYTPPEFVICNSNISRENKIHIENLSDKFDTYLKTFYDKEEGLYYQSIILEKKLENK